MNTRSCHLPIFSSLGISKLVLLFSLSVPAQAADNDGLTTEIAALIGTHNLALPPSFLPDPVIGIPAQAVTFGTNLALKNIQAPFVTPGDWSGEPNSTDRCSYDFQTELQQSVASYSNLLGFIDLKQVPEQWSDFTRNGSMVQVVHANTEVEVRVRGPHIIPDRRTPQQVQLPPGRHTYTWLAETQISDAFDIIIPAVLLTYNATKYAAAAADQGASAARQAARQNAARKIIENIAVETGLVTASQLFEGRTSVTHEKKQEITIYKVVPPVLETDQEEIVLEASDFGGVALERVAQRIRDTIDAYDPCNQPISLSNDAPALLPIGTTAITWTVRDRGPTRSGGVHTLTLKQQVTVEDNQAPLLIAPPSRVIEVPAAVSGLDAGSIVLGVPRVVDLADPSPLISRDQPDFYPKNSRTPITWGATDQSGNRSEALQLITVKTEGENTAPVVSDVDTDTLTSQAVDILLTGHDNDIVDGISDPLSFRLSRLPGHGSFVAPLYPYFIEDYRTRPEGPFGEPFRLSGNRVKWVYDNYCRKNREIPRDWVYHPLFVQVTDGGDYFMIDHYFWCNPSNGEVSARLSKWDKDGRFLGQIQYGGTNDTFVLDQDGLIYTLGLQGAGSSKTLTLTQLHPDFDQMPSPDDYRGDSWRFDFDSTNNRELGISDPVSNRSFAYARVDSRQGLIYLTDQRRVFVYDIRQDLADNTNTSTNRMGSQYLGALKDGDQFLCTTGNYGNSWTGFAIEVDSRGNLYVTDSCQDRIHQFKSSYFDAQGKFVMGDYVGWLGRCESSTNNACDEDRQISRGYACTDETCPVSRFVFRDGLNHRGTSGDGPGQFNVPVYIALDPNDILYVADAGDAGAGGRVQRFSPDGTFAGEARSTGTGINQGDRPGFVLGNLGTVKAVSVNSKNFFVVDQQESFIHVFQTSPLKDITDHSATVTYVSDFDFHNATDSFEYVASDGLADSGPGRVSVRVSRNYRAPEAIGQAVDTVEDTAVDILLSGDDPDGIAGIDFNGLDTLNFRIVTAPSHGNLILQSANNESATYRYQPEPDYFGEDRFTYVANDGRDDSKPATVSIRITSVEDTPKMTALHLPQRAGIGSPVVAYGQFWDDGAEDHFIEVDWGDGSPVEVEGDIVESGDQAQLVGIKLIKPAQGDGIGRAIGQHVYRGGGVKTVRFCISDQTARWDCREQQITPQNLESLVAHYSPDDSLLTIPVVHVGKLKYRAQLKLVSLEDSPTGFGLLLQSATKTSAVSDYPAIYLPSDGKVHLPAVDITRNDVRQRSVTVEMTLMTGSSPLLFAVTSVRSLD